jgi:hypothetical protein
VNTTGSSNTVTQTRSGSQSVPAHTFLVIELQTWPVHLTVPFQTNVVIDADLIPNDKGFAHLSNILDEGKRTFPISGTIEADDASSGQLVFFNEPYDSTKCPQAGRLATVNRYRPSATVKLTGTDKP